jgi:autotransporter-associated beta strand protein
MNEIKRISASRPISCFSLTPPFFIRLCRSGALVLIAVCVALGGVAPASAQNTFTWGYITNVWNTTTPAWIGGPSTIWQNPSFPADTANFGGPNATITVADGINLNRINFLTGSTTLAGGTLNLYAVDASLLGTFFVNGGASATISSTIATPLPHMVVKSGAGTLTLTGTSTFSGGITVSAGTLQIGDGGTTGSISGNIANNAALIFNRSDNLAYSGIISGTGTLTKQGTGTLTLTGANTFTGGTAVSAGTLIIGTEGSLVARNGETNGAVGEPGGISVSVLGSASLQTLVGSTITGGNGGSGSDQGGNGGAAITIAATGSVNNAGLVTGGTGGGQFGGQFGGDGGAGILVSGQGTVENSGVINGGRANVIAVTNEGGHGGTGVVFLSGGSLNNTGTISGGSGGSLGVAGNGGHGIAFNSDQTLINLGTISGGHAAQGNYQGGNGGHGVFITDGGILDNSGSLSGGSGSSGAFGSGSNGNGVRVSNLAGSLINRSGGSISGGVVMGDFANSVTLYNGSSITGGLNIGNSTAAALTLTGGSGSQNYSAAVGGTTTLNGQLIKSGTGTWVLDQAFSHTGGTTVTGFGTLAITSDAALGASGNGVTLDNGVLRTDAAMTIDRPVTIATNQVGFINTNGNNVTLSGAIGGNGGFIKQGAGTLTLANASNAQANTRIDPGTLSISSDAHLGQAGGTLFINGGTLQITQNVSASRPVVVFNGSTFATGNRQLVLGGNITGSGGVTFTGFFNQNASGNSDPNLVLTGAGEWTGSTTLRSTATSPVFQIGNFGTTGSLPAGGLVVLDPAGGSSGNVFLAFARSDDYTYDGTISDLVSATNNRGNVIQRGPGTLRFTGNHTYTGTTLVSGGTLIVNSGSTLDNTSGTGSGQVHVGNDPVFSLTSNPANLGGTGRIAGDVRVFVGSTVAPGDGGVGTLTTGSVSFNSIQNSRSRLLIDLNLGSTFNADLLNVFGDVRLGTTVGATLGLNLLNAPSYLEPTTFLIVANDGTDAVSGQFGLVTGLPAGWTYSLDYAFSGIDALGRVGTGNDIAITLSAIPEPSSMLLVGCGIVGLLSRRRRAVGMVAAKR